MKDHNRARGSATALRGRQSSRQKQWRPLYSGHTGECGVLRYLAQGIFKPPLHSIDAPIGSITARRGRLKSCLDGTPNSKHKQQAGSAQHRGALLFPQKKPNRQKTVDTA